MKYYKQAETLFLQENLSIDEICKNLNVSRRTIFIGERSMNGTEKKLKN